MPPLQSIYDSQPLHAVVPRVPVEWMSNAAPESIRRAVEGRARYLGLLDTQKDDPVTRPLDPATVRAAVGNDEGPGAPGTGSVDLAELYEWAAEYERARQERALLREVDPFHHGYENESWDEIDWETCRLRVRFPGVPVEAWIMGANGSGKSNFCASRVSRAMNQVPGLYWCFSLDLRNSNAIQQDKIYYYLPTLYKTDSGKVKRTQRAALNYNSGGGFTDNKFSLHNGGKCEFRFYGDNADPKSTEGPRPHMAWSDEEIPLTWIDNINNRLLTYAGTTRAHVSLFQHFLKQKQTNPPMLFPREHIGKLYTGVHLVSFTPKNGYTQAVRAATKGGVVIREIEAELLPKERMKAEG